MGHIARAMAWKKRLRAHVARRLRASEAGESRDAGQPSSRWRLRNCGSRPGEFRRERRYIPCVRKKLASVRGASG